jgi:endonuclease/exonuclease/phosphatase family metal-dependent hydrolase
LFWQILIKEAENCIFAFMFRTIKYSSVLILVLFFSCQPTENQQEISSEKTKEIKIGFYNVENLFDTQNDPRVKDEDFLPEGLYNWDDEKLGVKLANISQVINDLDVDLLGLAEVENKEVIELLCQKLETKYEIVHFESHDIRGIDVALLYNPKIFTLRDATELIARMPDGDFAGPRNILKVSLKSGNQDFIVYVNHLPSRKNENQNKRYAYAKTLLEDLQNAENQTLISMGDYNDTPLDPSLLLLQKKLANPFQSMKKGTSMHDGDWFLFDQILFQSNDYQCFDAEIFNNPYMVNQRKGKFFGAPKRSIISNHFVKDGYSDHFPVKIILKSIAK